MRSIHVLLILGWLFIGNNHQLKANDSIKISQTPTVEIGFFPDITAPDLKIKRLTAVLVNDSILFTLEYTSQKDRFLSFFNPPNGNKLKYFDHNGIKKNDTLVTFYIAKTKFKSIEGISMRFSEHRNRMIERDRNFISLDKDFVKGLVTTETTKSSYPDFFSHYTKNHNSNKKFQDVRWKNLLAIQDSLTYEAIGTFTYNKDSKFGKHTPDAEQIMEKAKNPGLGIRSLHKQGITGKGVNTAIIDQNLPGKHPEYVGKITKYKDFGCKQSKNRGSMHAPGVLSLLAGNTIGTAPDAQVFLAATPSWTRDAKYPAEALLWIIKESHRLPKENKIRVVSLSGAPSGPGTPFTKNNQEWDEAVKVAEQEGIIVLDCTNDHGFIGPSYYDSNNPEDVKKCKVGYPDKAVKDSSSFPSIKIFAPCSGRTVAEEYKKGTNSYQYCGKGGLSWSIPYVAGVMAMGWQIKPALSGPAMVTILLETASTNFQGYKIIDPVKFIEYLRQMN